MAEGTTSGVVESDQAVFVAEEGGLLCGPCLEDGQQLPADGYCVTCAEHLCQHCFSCHTVPKYFRKHVLQDRHEMPSTKSNAETSKSFTYRCSLHNEHPLTSYCMSHGRLCCEKCVAIGHQACKDVQLIDKMSANMQDNKEFQEFAERLVFLKKRNETNKAKSLLNAERIDSCYNRCVDDFSATLCKIKDKDKSKNRAVQSSTDHVLQQVTTWQTDIERHEKNKDDNSLFILMKTARKDIEMIETNTSHVEKENTIESYIFQRPSDPFVIGKVMRTPCEVKRLNVKHPSENGTCTIRGLILLENGKMLVSDYGNQSIKLLDIESGTVESVAKLKNWPLGMTLTEDKQLFATQPTAKKILHFPSPINKLNSYREIPVEFEARTIKYTGQTLTVEFRSNPMKIVELDLDGKLMKTVVSDCTRLKTDQGEYILTNPTFLSHNPRKKSLVYTDYSQGTLVEIMEDGKARLVVKSKHLNSPHGIAHESGGSYLVCSYGGKRVVRVTDDGDISDVITGIPEPVVLALDEKQQLLYIGGDSDVIYVYHL